MRSWRHTGCDIVLPSVEPFALTRHYSAHAVTHKDWQLKTVLWPYKRLWKHKDMNTYMNEWLNKTMSIRNQQDVCFSRRCAWRGTDSTTNTRTLLSPGNVVNTDQKEGTGASAKVDVMELALFPLSLSLSPPVQDTRVAFLLFSHHVLLLHFPSSTDAEWVNSMGMTSTVPPDQSTVTSSHLPCLSAYL